MAHFLLLCTWDFDDLGCHHNVIIILLYGTLQPVQAGLGKLVLCIGHNHIIILAFVIFILTGYWVVACHRVTNRTCYHTWQPSWLLPWPPKFVPCAYSLVVSLSIYGHFSKNVLLSNNGQIDQVRLLK